MTDLIRADFARISYSTSTAKLRPVHAVREGTGVDGAGLDPHGRGAQRPNKREIDMVLEVDKKTVEGHTMFWRASVTPAALADPRAGFAISVTKIRGAHRSGIRTKLDVDGTPAFSIRRICRGGK